MTQQIFKNQGFEVLFTRITNFRFVKIITSLGLTSYIILLFSSIFLTRLFGYHSFSPITNLISDLGKLNVNPAPYLFDTACIISGLFSFPFTLYSFKNYYFRYKFNRDIEDPRLFSALSIGSFFSGLVGHIGTIGVGIFSLDRDIYNLHWISAGISIVGYIIVGILMGSLILKYDLGLPKKIGISGLAISSTISIIFLTAVIFQLELGALFEWFAIYGLTIWLWYFTFYVLIRGIRF
ncbi:MAG: DUF998 domain-containing protein [Candidatus Lokiarchaeota archaeon]|nr:DUF998 domain-containing protein [Candidatus Lokiarchaeota archaeon]MBD3201977.1 DUF998 domain-containing protein [Candidatus Lokiarchaeota archaeon]